MTSKKLIFFDSRATEKVIVSGAAAFVSAEESPNKMPSVLCHFRTVL